MAQPRMFTDDTNVSYTSESLDEIQYVINSELKNLNSWLIANRLSLNIAKTEFMIIGSRQKNERYRERYSRAEVVNLRVYILIDIFPGQSIFIRFQKRFLPLLARLNAPEHL